MLSVIMLSVVMLSVVKLSVIMLKCQYSEYHYVDAKPSISYFLKLSVMFLNCYGECHHAEYH